MGVSTNMGFDAMYINTAAASVIVTSMGTENGRQYFDISKALNALAEHTEMTEKERLTVACIVGHYAAAFDTEDGRQEFKDHINLLISVAMSEDEVHIVKKSEF